MPSPHEELQSISQILHLTHHRNKNQHRLAKWWRAFSMLRRNISKLSTELDTNIQYTALSAKSKKTIESREIVERRVEFLEDHLVPRAYLAFSQLVADNQYAALGLMLVGTLARVRKVIAPLRGDSEMGDEMIEGKRLEGPGVKEGQDFGEVVKRDEIIGKAASKDQQLDDEEREDTATLQQSKKRYNATEEAKESPVQDSTTMKRPKKKRKKGDAFDELFAGLV
jgi:ribonuclease MRP protein subunit RMP1